tara:strand:+ start:284 stop:913 length:630 start_codon:yes stop_codon:yes gene_type:complete
MTEYKINSLFPSTVMETKYTGWREEDTALAMKLLDNPNPGVYNWNSKDRYILNSHFPDLRKFIEDAIRVYAEHIIVGAKFDKSEYDFRITQSWLNLCKGSAMGHHRHTHANSIISGVFYIQVNEGVDVIQFDDGKSTDTIVILPKKFNDFNANAWTKKVYNGQLLLFHSSMGHFVPPLQSTNDRISLSFNCFPYGNIGDDSAFCGLTVK